MAEFVPVSKGRQRLIFGSGHDVIPLPDMVEVQRESYRSFFQEGAAPGDRESVGLQELLDEISPISNFDGSFRLEFLGYEIDEPSMSQEEAKRRDCTWHRPIRAKVRLHNDRAQEVREEEIYLGDFPVMTPRGTFIINGTERVVVNQLARSAGVYFKSEPGASGAQNYSAKIIPERGAWVEFVMAGDSLSVNIDSRRKLPATLLLKAFGLGTNEELLKAFGGVVEDLDIVTEEAAGRLLAESVTDSRGQVLLHEGTRLDKDGLELLWEQGRTSLKVWNVAPIFVSALEKENTNSTDEALLEILRRMRPNEPVRIEGAREYFDELFLDVRRYTLGRVGRYKLNRRLGLNLRKDEYLLTLDDLIRIVKGLVALRDTEEQRDDVTFPEIGEEYTDDIDHLGNRRVRSIGELLQSQLRIGMLRLERIAKERMTTVADLSKAMVRDLINVRPLAAALREFFGSGQLSQFMDQNNPLSELTHRRRLSALGPGGLSRERAGFEARDVHYTHYGRICPIETPEGPNIGLVTSLGTYARLNEYGFLITPRRPVKNGAVSTKAEDVVYLSADEEDNYYVGRANTPFDPETGRLTEDAVYARYKGDIVKIAPEQVDFLDVSSKQVVSASAALIPFLEHDDANRALMGSNMQRQAVPLLLPKAPFVGTGIEERVARDSGCCVYSSCDGSVTYVDSDRIEVTDDSGARHEFELDKFLRSNQGTIIHQRPTVDVGDKVKADELLADGQSVDGGELALGRNVLIAFVPWEGYNYEDAILLSEKLVKEDYFSSIHIEEYEIDSRDTKLGPEEITRDIPNVGEDALRNLDEDGVVRIGAEVNPGDILVGKVTPKGEADHSPEEKLLRAIFGEKAGEVRDTSLHLPHGTRGKVVSVKRLNHVDNPESLSPGVNEVIKVYVAQWRKITVGDKMSGRHGNKGVVSRILPVEDMPYLPDGTPVDVCLNPLGVPSRMNLGQVLEVILGFVALKNGWHVGTPVFEGATEEEIYKMLQEISDRDPGLRGKLSSGGTIRLCDGRTGDLMAEPSTVGVMYMLKLNHLVDDKLHARSVGPYSLITQQPLGGKAQFGGQRFGEMEVWALQGYGAAHVLQEMLTVKSDDIRGRLKTYEKIIKGQNLTKPGVPESFKVLVKELEGLGLTVSIDYSDGTSGPLPIDDDDDGPRRPSDIDNITANDMMFAAEGDLPAQPAERNAEEPDGEDEFGVLPDADEENAGGGNAADPEAQEMPNLNE
ncbi:DNA-directed RNA polymerase subunit beta [Pyramidobacter sp. SM-530-WT-4B]|uniref:DNA-directed RNA polymerase subunit beta n=1 Tax=Pyramidobacter porci TaxID=2605789 RepID=A0A6L5YB05_9BACT|nr:DNA-directed RNA polymerase subunit beta [Pyramidobacter porci]MDY2647724.1 DNA-directed RNA polymerase subunit beta [Pyramidobacter porci]MST55484.1 DNA-directed RNA polymerase subunit beta [Pyramidobacter porci]